MRNIIILSMLFCLIFFTCGDDDSTTPEQPAKATISGTITNASSSAVISGVYIILYNADTNAPMSNTSTDASGNYSFSVDAGNYFLKLYKQGFTSIPATPDIPPLPISAVAGQTSTYSVSMTPLTITNIGMISGKVSDGSTGKLGVLLVSDNGTIGYSTVSDADGNYRIYNVVAGNYTVSGWIKGYNSTSVTNVAVVQDQDTSNVNLTLTVSTGIKVTGKISFLSTTNIEVDVSLVNRYTKETIPGLSTQTVGYLYEISDVPNGTYLCRASYKNDGKVMDPDSIIKFGEPTVTIAGASVIKDFDVTGAQPLTSPTNLDTSTSPVVVTTLTPTFEWESYSSANDYVIEVKDSNGVTVWGGFTVVSTSSITKNVDVVKPQTSIVYNSINPGTALENGKTYRWKVYVSKDDGTEAVGWKLISVSEDQKGLFKVVLP